MFGLSVAYRLSLACKEKQKQKKGHCVGLTHLSGMAIFTLHRASHAAWQEGTEGNESREEVRNSGILG